MRPDQLRHDMPEQTRAGTVLGQNLDMHG
jgi:hypothetical protein